MGEVGGYQLHLYCDHPKHDHTSLRPYRTGFGEFFGARSLTDARKAANKEGWRKRPQMDVADIGNDPAWVCPACAKITDKPDA